MYIQKLQLQLMTESWKTQQCSCTRYCRWLKLTYIHTHTNIIFKTSSQEKPQ